MYYAIALQELLTPFVKNSGYRLFTALPSFQLILPTSNPKKLIKMAGSVSVWSGNGYAQIGSTVYGDVAKDYFGASVSAGDTIIGIPGFDLPVTVSGKTKLQKDAGKVTVVNGAEF